MTKEFLFVSCDIIGHSSEPDIARQIERIDAINRIVEDIIGKAKGKEVVWASGGDGGHVAFPAEESPALAVDLVCLLKQWSIRAKVRLRLTATKGPVASIKGADGRVQLVGYGINLAGRVLNVGDQSRIIATAGFREAVGSAADNRLIFHDDLEIEPIGCGREIIYLVSLVGGQRSTWADPPGISDDAMLQKALSSGRALEVVYRAKRLLEVQPRNSAAVGALRTMAQSDQMALPTSRNTIGGILLDEHFGPALVEAGTLIERFRGENLCAHGDEGRTMFLILRGKVGVYLPRTTDDRRHAMEPDFVMEPGELAGELAFALNRRRTATLKCVENVAVLTFGHDELLRSIAHFPGKGQLVEMFNRRILSRVVENVWNTAPIFCNSVRGAIPTSSQFPWLELQPYCLQRSFKIKEGVIKKLLADFPGEGLCLLLSGRLKTNPAGRILTGETYPPLWMRMSDEPELSLENCAMLDEINVLFVEKAGLTSLGNDAYHAILDRVRAQFSQKPPDKMSTEGLSKISGCDNPTRVADVIFVHGLDGDATTTWHPKDDPNAFWPKWLGAEFPTVGIWSLGYAVSASAWRGSTMPLFDRAINTLDKLELEGIGSRPAIFICHSLGGLLVKQMLRCAQDFGNAEYRKVAEQTKAIVFLSTPHTGADMASWLQHIGTLLRTTVSVEELQAQHPRLRELNTWYRNSSNVPRIKILVYCEKKTVGGILVVNEATADPGLPGVIPIPLDEDHISICKPSSQTSQVYRRVCRLIEDTVIGKR